MEKLQRMALDESEDADESLIAGTRVDFEVFGCANHHKRLVALRSKAANAHRERCLVVGKLQSLESLKRNGVDDADTARPFVLLGGNGRSAVVLVDVGDVVLLIKGLLFELRIGVVVGL